MNAKIFKDFTFTNKKFSSLSTDYIAVDFNNDDEKYLALERDMEIGETNRYRTEANYFYDKWSDNLRFEMHIIKDPCKYFSQKDQSITESEIREISRWLTSPHLPSWIKFEYDESDNNEVVNYFGWFKNIETFVVGGRVYGLKLYFECTTPFGYTDYFTNEIAVSSYDTLTITNNDDAIYGCNYPTIDIKPKVNGQFYICNLSDCKIFDSGVLEAPIDVTYFDVLLDTLENYGFLKGYDVEYIDSGDKDDAFNITPLCDDTAVQFYYVDKYDNRTKCTAFYLPDTKVYRIIEGGFMYMTAYRDLNIYIDCKRLTINDELGRMITYDKLGITDVDSIYWTKLVNGDNTLLFYGNCDFTIKHIESRKVGE